MQERSVTKNELRVYYHIIRKTDGTDGQNSYVVNESFSILNSDYNAYGIYFKKVDSIDYIDNSDLFFHPSSSVFSINSHSDGIDIYLFPDEALESGGLASGIGVGTSLYVSGLYWKPPYQSLAMSHVISHEMGHLLYLWHTHHGTFNEGSGGDDPCQEYVDGSNSDVCGDYVEDTPADPNLNYNVNPSTFEWLGYGFDAHGDAYNPNTRLIMSYTDIRCMALFTPKQIERAKYAIRNFPHLRQTLVMSITGESIPCDNSVYYIENLPDSCNVSWSWETPYGPVMELENVGEDSLSSDEVATPRILDPGPPIIEGPLLLQNQPATNQCTLSKNGFSYIKNTIIATVKKNGTTIATLRKSVDTGINFTGGYAQAAHNYTGWYYPGVSATPFRSGDMITLLRGSTITLTADKFVGANITYSGTTPINWTHNGSTISFYFSYLDIVDPYVPMTETLFPLQRPASLTITGTYSNSCESFQFTIVGLLPNIPSQLMADTGQDEGLHVTAFGQSMTITRPTGDEQWTLSIINSSTGAITYEGIVHDASSKTISTVGWPAGIYVIRVKTKDGEWSAKSMVAN